MDPRYNTLGHKLLLSGDRGAAAVLGAATLTEAKSDEAIGPLVMQRVVEPGMTLGQAILDAKQVMKESSGGACGRPVRLALLGDPMLVLSP